MHRSILTSKQFVKETDLKIWIWLLCKASFSIRHITVKIGKGTQIITINRGQLIFGRHKAEEELRIDGSTIYRTLQRFQDDKAILIEPNNQYSIIEILQFNDYQEDTQIHDFEILEDRTTNEQPMNNQRAGNDQPLNSKRAGIDQQTNSKRTQYKKVNKDNNEIEFKEGSEGKKIKEEKPRAKSAVHVDPVFQDFVDAYFDFYQTRCGGPPAFNGRDGKAMKTIVGFMRGQVRARYPDLTHNEEDAKAIEGIKWVFGRWDKLPIYEAGKLTASAMAQSINEIFSKLTTKQKNGKKPTGGDVTNEDLARAAHAYAQAGGKF